LGGPNHEVSQGSGQLAVSPGAAVPPVAAAPPKKKCKKGFKLKKVKTKSGKVKRKCVRKKRKKKR
jgi:hypothetical protein